MENIEIYANLIGDEMVAVTNQDGSVTSMPKATYDTLPIEEFRPNLAGNEAEVK